MDTTTIYSKTAKGMTEVRNGCKNLARDAAKVLTSINGKSTVADFIGTGGMSAEKLGLVLDVLSKSGLIRVFVAARDPAVVEWSPSTASASDDGIDFSESLPALEVEELSPQESVQAWAQARRGATELKKTGFYSYGSKSLSSLGSGKAGLSALIVEDDEELAELLLVLLGEKGFAVQTAGDIGAAMSLMQTAAPPDLVLLDIMLPGMPGKDGFDVLAAIRRKDSWAKVPVVMVTSEVSDEQVMKGLKAGADAYIFKPFKWETLYECIRSVIGI